MSILNMALLSIFFARSRAMWIPETMICVTLLFLWSVRLLFWVSA